MRNGSGGQSVEQRRRIGPRGAAGAAVAALTLAAAPVEAHDFWLQMRSYHPDAGQADPMIILVGHGKDKTRWAGKVERVVQFRSAIPQGSTDLRKALQPGDDSDALLKFDRPGAAMLVFESTLAQSELPSIRFNDYAKLEGLTPALEARAAAKATDAPGRETYSRRAKALIQVGPPDAAGEKLATTPVGLTLEIVPLKSPYALKADEPLPVRVLYEGRPLKGALVKLTNLEFDIRPVAMHLTDNDGRASFALPRTGEWLVNVIWTKPLHGDPKADFDTTFSSLTFGFKPVAAAR